MRSKLAALLALVLLPSCSLRLNDHVEAQKHTVNASGTGCLAKAGDVFDQFQKGTLSEGEHAAFFDCTNKAITMFLEHVDGSAGDRYAPSELGSFLTKYFLDGKPIQPALLDEFMALKAALVGGAPDALTRADLRHMQEISGYLRTLSGTIRTSMPLSAAAFLARGFRGDEFETAVSGFVKAVGVFGSQMGPAQGSYPFSHFEGLIRELRAFLYPQGVPEEHWSNLMIRVAKVLPPAKAIFISPPRDEVTAADWPKLYHLAPRYYASTMRAQYYLSAPWATIREGALKTIDRLFHDFLHDFSYVLAQQPGGVITSDQIDELVLTAYDQKFLPCRPDTARQFIRVLFGRLLGGQSETQFTVNSTSLDRFAENTTYLLDGLHSLEALYRSRLGDEAYFEGSLSRAEIEGQAVEPLVGPSATSVAREAVTEVLRSTKVRTVFPASEGYVLIPERGLPEQFSFLHMARLHALRSLNRLLFQAYGGTPTDGLSEAQLNQIVDDVFPMLTELHLVDESMRASIKKRLLEGSLFLYSSDGNRGMTMTEALEMESLLFSTLKLGPTVHKRIADACTATRTDADGKKLIPRDCYKREFLAHASDAWAHVPGLAHYAESLDDTGRAKLFDDMVAVFRPATAGDDFTLMDSLSFVQFPFYVELLFSRFDTNGDGQLVNVEGDVAYPVFKPFIAEKAAAKGYTRDADHQAIFNFLLAYRELPTDSQWTYAFRRYLLGAKRYTVNRGQVVEIFARLLAL